MEFESNEAYYQSTQEKVVNSFEELMGIFGCVLEEDNSFVFMNKRYRLNASNFQFKMPNTDNSFFQRNANSFLTD